jgi:hypothetical protein
MACTASGEFNRYLSACVGIHLDEHLKFLISQVSKGVTDKRFKDEVQETLAVIERNGVKLLGKRCAENDQAQNSDLHLNEIIPITSDEHKYYCRVFTYGGVIDLTGTWPWTNY